MAVELLPSVLATTQLQLQQRLRLAQRLSRVIHVDYMDGRFVRRRSVSLASILRQPRTSNIELHLMAERPERLLESIIALRPRRVYLHVEIGNHLVSVIAAIRSHGIRVGLAINPSTAIQRVAPYMSSIDSLLVLAVRPGQYGGRYVATTPQRVAQIHRRWPKLRIACDGSMNPRTMPAVLRAGARKIIIGSDVALSDTPLLAWKRDRRVSDNLK